MHWSSCVNTSLQPLRSYRYVIYCLITLLALHDRDEEQVRSEAQNILPVEEVRGEVFQAKEISANVFYASEENVHIVLILVVKVKPTNQKNTKFSGLPLEFFWAKTIRSIHFKVASNTEIIHQIFFLLNLFCIYLDKKAIFILFSIIHSIYRINRVL